MARIELRSLAHSYAGPDAPLEEHALAPTDLEWADGQTHALLGPSGCGKTTLLNAISGLLTPTAGRVLFDGVDVTERSTRERNIAQVFQFPVVYDTMTVFENLAFPLRNRRLAAGEVSARVGEVAEVLELTGDLQRRARGLTADAKQRLALGRGLVRDDVAAILLDEPMTVIDPARRWSLRRKLREVHHALGRTLIHVTHDQGEALTIADRVVVMDAGRVVQVGTPRELVEAPTHTFVATFIGNPGMNLLPCTVAEGTAVVAHTVLPLPPELAARAKEARGALELGIRPEHLELDPDGNAAARVERIADLGRYWVADLSLDGQALKIKGSGGPRPVPGESARLRFPPQRLILFADGVALA